MPGNVRFMPWPVALVTDSVASLPTETAAERGITVVPLQVVVGDTSYDEGADGPATPQRIAEALRARTRVRTSRPTPSAFAETYRKVVAEGAAEIAIEPEVAHWDMAAVQVIVEEAGGRFTNLQGERRADGGSGVSTNGLLHDAVLAAFA